MSTDWNRLQSQTIDWLRFPMAVMVVLLHHGVKVLAGANGPLRILCIFFAEGVCRVAVPFFFFVSGYLFFSGLEDWDWNKWAGKIKKRVHSLFIPYLLWNFVAFFALWGYNNLTGDASTFSEAFSRYGGIRIFYGVGGIPISIHAMPLDSPLWFIRDLMYLVLISPIIYKAVKLIGVYGIVTLCLVFVTVKGIIPEGFVMFCLGSYLRLRKKNILELVLPKSTFFIVSSALLLAILVYCLNIGAVYWSRVAKCCFFFTGIGASFCAGAKLLKGNRVRVRPFLVRGSFFVYALHLILVLNIACLIVNKLLPQGCLWRIVELFLTPAVAVTVCLGILFLMESVLPRTTSLLTGSRRIIRADL